jgi:hypothetical protein
LLRIYQWFGQIWHRLCMMNFISASVISRIAPRSGALRLWN